MVHLRGLRTLQKSGDACHCPRHGSPTAAVGRQPSGSLGNVADRLNLLRCLDFQDAGASCTAKQFPDEVRVAFSLIPRSEHFFDDFVGLAKEIREGSRLLKQMMSSDPPDMAKAEAIKDVEH